MAWQGVPFPYFSNAVENLSVALSSIPKIILESPTDLSTPLMTAAAAVIGGCIPAAIAWRTFKLNSAQLQTERKEQQNFLREERIAQSESLEADRQMQLLIAEKNFNMQVLSVNRQAWINSLRELISECCVFGEKLFDANSHYYFKRKIYDDYIDKTEHDLTSRDNAVVLEFAGEFNLAHSQLNEVRERHDLILVKIQLMLNPSESESSAIMTAIMRLRCRGGELGKEGNSYASVYPLVKNDIAEIIRLSHICLKKEWMRVKEGT
ncbi:TPA: hypothetical protein ACH1PF_001016 [Enterobacter cloacae]